MTRHYYVTMRDADKLSRVALLVGPFAEHEQALAQVRTATNAAIKANAWYHFNAFGTSSIESDDPPQGKLNDVCGIVTPRTDTPPSAT